MSGHKKLGHEKTNHRIKNTTYYSAYYLANAIPSQAYLQQFST